MLSTTESCSVTVHFQFKAVDGGKITITNEEEKHQFLQSGVCI